MSNAKPEIVFFDRKLIEERDHWVGKLSGVSEPSTLRPDYPRVGQFHGRNGVLDLNMPQELYGKLLKLTNSGPFLIYTTLMAALKVCLFRYSGIESVAVGSPARRQGGESDEFVNGLAIVDDVDDRLSFKEFLLKQRDTLLEAYSRQRYPFRQLLADLRLSDTENGCPLFDVALTLNEIHHRMYEARHGIQVTFDREPERMKGRVEFNSDIFKPETVERFAGHFLNILEAAVENPSAKIGAIPMLSEEERHRILVEWNDTRKEFPSDCCAHHLFEAQVERTPQAIALQFGDRSVTYQELDERANKIARYLQQLGVGPESLVGICIERSIEMVEALLGTLKAGGGYVPLDASYPRERLAYMAKDAGIRVLLTQSSLLDNFSHLVSHVVCLDSSRQQVDSLSPLRP
ncbi:MAG TPA: AMP-binding protein, partial [Blastocatellia bacterium]|nr:AMP-binding protein [Blastocatellia bacterium]